LYSELEQSLSQSIVNGSTNLTIKKTLTDTLLLDLVNDKGQYKDEITINAYDKVILQRISNIWIVY